ncbi:MAG TPA: hypothetical protein VM688_10260 [Nocardioidaceae bacterium]|nr:hypothetical protein [Nocardioidaceae bacterium]
MEGLEKRPCLERSSRSYDSGVIPPTLAPEDVEKFNALPRLPQEIPDDFQSPSVIVTDIVTGRTY